MDEKEFSQALSRIQEMMLELVEDIQVLSGKIREYVGEVKKTYQILCGNADVGEKSLLQHLEDVEKSVKAVHERMKKQVPQIYILRSQMKHPEIIELMKSAYKTQMQMIPEETADVIRKILRGEMSRSEYVLYEIKKRKSGEQHVG